jgi:hypothetical protein
MGIIDNLINSFTARIADAVASRVLTQSGQRIAQARAYRLGKQPHQLKVKPNQYDDNLILNFTGLIVDRSVSQMVGGGISFKFEGDDGQAELPQKEWIEDIWDANHQEILLHRCALAAAEAGTAYLMLCDPALGMGSANENGVEYPRLLMLDPAFVTIETVPEDYEVVLRYIIQYKTIGPDGKELVRRKTIERDEENLALSQWVIIDEELSYKTGSQFVEVGRIEWPYDFAPIVHWQNLPTIDSPYGEPDITGDLMATQDSLNGDASSLNKSLRLGADPLRWAKGLDGFSKVETGAGTMVNVGPDGEINQLEPATDWNGSLAFAKFIRQALFDISRTVDIDSLNDRLGSLTNFALKVIYQDNASKIATKRELMGDALEEVNRRLQIMAGAEPIETEVIWSDFMPVNEVERGKYFLDLLNAGVISKQTACEELGYDWEDEQERMTGESAAADNIGGALLAAFTRGEGAAMPPMVLPGRAPQNVEGVEANQPA